MPALPGNLVKGATIVSSFAIRRIEDVTERDSGPEIGKTRIVARLLHGKKGDERSVRMTRFQNRDRMARQASEINYDRFFVLQCLESNGVFIILTDSPQIVPIY